MTPQAEQIISLKFTRLISFGLITRPHFGQLAFSEARTFCRLTFLREGIRRIFHTAALVSLSGHCWTQEPRYNHCDFQT